MSTWPHSPDTAPGRLCREADLDRAMHRKACATCAGTCNAPQACEQPEHHKPDRLVRAWNALRRLVLRPRLALLRWQLDCVRDERERYDELGWASPVFLRNCFQQELRLAARIRELTQEDFNV